LFFGVGNIMNDEYDDVLDNDSDDGALEVDLPVTRVEVNQMTVSEVERARARQQLAADVEAFLARGGSIQSIDMNVMADPPKAPQSNYGGQPI
jgi:hypothetical protein